MRRIALVLVLLLAAALPLFGWAQAPESSAVEAEGVLYELTPEKAIIVGFVPGAQTARIPALFQGLPTAMREVHSPEDTMYFSLGELEELILGEGITALEAYPALKWWRIRRVILPSTLVLTGDMNKLWYGKSWLGFFPWLEEVTFPANVSETAWENFLAWEWSAYWMSGHALGDVTIDFWGDNSSVDTIQFDSLTHVRIAPGHPILYDIDGVIFRKGTDELVFCPPARAGAYAVPEGTKSIGKKAFENCNKLESLSIPRSVTAVGEAAFSGCASLRTLQLPFNLREIGREAFLNCRALTTLILPDGVGVGPNAFQYAVSLRAVYAPGMETIIDPSAFRTSSTSLTVYAPEGTSAYHAAALNDLLWAEIDGEPRRLYNPNYIHTAIVHAEEETAVLPLYREASEGSGVLMKQPVGSTAKVLEVGEGWAHVEFYGGVGYMPLTSLQMVAKEDCVERVLKVRYWVDNDMGTTFIPYEADALLYTEPERSAPTVSLRDWHLDVLQRYGTWYMVEVDEKTYYLPVKNTSSYSMHMVAPGRLGVVCAKGEGQRARLYTRPDQNSESLGVYYNGTQVIIVPKKIEDAQNPDYSLQHDDLTNGFYHVRVNGQDGFMEGESLSWVRQVFFYRAY